MTYGYKIVHKVKYLPHFTRAAVESSSVALDPLALVRLPARAA